MSEYVKGRVSEHWYTKSGEPVHFVPKKDGMGTKPTTIREAREMNLVPSVSTILRVLNKPELNDWITEQHVLAALTTPRHKGETVDQFIHRIFHVEKIQDQESKVARDRGTAIHDAIACALANKPFDIQWIPYVESVLPIINTLGRVVWIEKILVGQGYAGRADILIESDEELALLDFKSAKKLPKESYPDHRVQTSMYAQAMGNTNGKRVITGNVYLSTTMPGDKNLCLQTDWSDTYNRAARPLVQLWQFLNKYTPE